MTDHRVDLEVLARDGDYEALLRLTRDTLRRGPASVTLARRQIPTSTERLKLQPGPWDPNLKHLRSIAPLQSCIALRDLDLSDNRISELGALSGLRCLKRLVLNNNPIVDVSPLSGLRHLTHLELGCAFLEDISALSTLSGLEHLDLSFSSVVDVEPLLGLSRLKTLRLVHTRANRDNVDGVRALFEALPSLERLSITGLTRDTRGLETAIGGLSRLVELRFHKDRYPWPGFLGAALEGLEHLETLSLSEMRLRSFEPLAGLVHLKHLNLSRTRLSDLSPLLRLTQLESLNLVECPLEHHIYPFHNMPWLRRLDLGHATLRELPASPEHRFEWIDLSHSTCTDIRELAQCQHLRFLDLRQSRVSDADKRTIQEALPRCIVEMWYDKE